MDLKKFIISFLVFLILANFLVVRRGGRLHYSPLYDYAHDPFFSYIMNTPGRGTILAGYVQSHDGLNFQVATGKQYFVPIMNSHTYKGQKLMIFCYDNFTDSYPSLVKAVAACFHDRSKEEWQMVSEALDVHWVATLKEVEIPALKKVAANADFNLYEIEKKTNPK